MKNTPIIKTERLVLSKLSATDIPTIVQYAANENIAKYTLNLPHPYFEKDAVFWVNLANEGYENGSRLNLAMRNKKTLDFMGGIGLTINKKNNRAEVAYWIGEPFWSKGFTTEATKAIMKYGFDELGLNKITSTHMSENIASGKVMIKSGMVKEGELIQDRLKNGVYHDVMLYGITKEEYSAK